MFLRMVCEYGLKPNRLHLPNSGFALSQHVTDAGRKGSVVEDDIFYSTPLILHKSNKYGALSILTCFAKHRATESKHTSTFRGI